MTPSAFAALEALAARGACLAMPEPGRLVFLPDDAASPDDHETLRSARSWLLSAWQEAAAWDVANPPRPDVDPLPSAPGDDDQADADTWAAILALAAAGDGADPFGLTGTLRFARCMGARLSLTSDGRLCPVMPEGHQESEAVAAAWSSLRERAGRID